MSKPFLFSGCKEVEIESILNQKNSITTFRNSDYNSNSEALQKKYKEIKQVFPIAGLVITRDKTIRNLKQVLKTRPSRNNTTPTLNSIVDIFGITEDKTEVIVGLRGIPGKLNIPIEDILDLSGLILKFNFTSKLYQQHTVYLQIQEGIELSTKNGYQGIPLKLIACDIPKIRLQEMEAIKAMLKTIAPMLDHLNKESVLDAQIAILNDISAIAEKTHPLDTKDLLYSIIKTKEFITRGKPLKDVVLLKDAIEDLSSFCVTDEYVGDEFLAHLRNNVFSNTTTISIEDTTGFLIASNTVLNIILRSLYDHNRDIISTKYLLGKKTLHKETGKYCTIVHVVDDDEIVIKFDNEIKGGHCLDGLQSKNSCLTVDSTMVELTTNLSILKNKVLCGVSNITTTEVK